MNKMGLFICLLVTITMTSLSWAQETPTKVIPGMVQYQTLKIALDFIAETIASSGLRLSAARVSPVIRRDNSIEFPLEISFSSVESKLVPGLQKLLDFSSADSRLAHSSINISLTGEITTDCEVLLQVTQNQMLMVGSEAKFPILHERNQKFVHALTQLLKITTFTPQVRRKLKGVDVGPGETWITNLRIDNSNRIQLTGFGLSVKQVTQLGLDLLKSGCWSDLSISSINRNTLERVPVWRFDIYARGN